VAPFALPKLIDFVKSNSAAMRHPEGGTTSSPIDYGTATRKLTPRRLSVDYVSDHAWSIVCLAPRPRTPHGCRGLRDFSDAVFPFASPLAIAAELAAADW